MPDGQHYAFLALARDLGLLGAEDAAALRESKTPAYQATVQRQLLSPETAQGVQGALERGHFLCSGCGLDLRYGHLGTLPSLACPTCGQTLTYREPSAPQTRPRSERQPRPAPSSGRGAASPHSGLGHPSSDRHSGLGRPSSDRHSGLGRPSSDRHSGLGRPSSDRHSGLGRPSSDRHSGLGRPSSDRHSGLGRPCSDRNSGLGRPSSDRNSGLGRPSSDRNSGLGRPSGLGRDSSRRAKEAKKIGDFILERELGRGNNGVVYLARRSGLDRQFAVKILLHTSKLGPEARQRFLLEAQIGSKLTHPGIVPVYDLGEENDYLFFAMQYVAGEDLAKRLEREKRLPPSLAAGMVRDLAESLAEAHTQQVVHRDIKPANVLLPDDGSRPRLTDFGLAKDRELAESMTKSGDILGSPFYMSPEQLQGARVTPLADVYALGVILYQCLTGRRPYEAKTPFDLAKKVMAGQCVPPRQYVEDLPPDLEQICLRAIHVKPEQRTPSAEVLRQELSDFLAGRRVRGGAPPARVGPLALVLGSLAALVLGVGLTLALASFLGGNPAFEEAHAALHAAPPTDAGELRAGLEALVALDSGDERVPRAKAWAAGWEELWKADAALERGALGEAKGALERAAAAAEAGPFLAEARAQRQTKIGHLEVLLALQAEVRGRPLSPEVLGRWRELRAQVSDPGLRRRVQGALLDCLADRQLLETFQAEKRELSDPAEKARQRLREGWLYHERGQRADATRIFQELASKSGEVPEATRLAAAALIHSVEHRREDARPLLRAALREEPEFALVKFWLGVTLALSGRMTEAERLLTDVDTSLRDNVSYAVWRSRIYLAQQKPHEALALAQRGLSLLGDQLSERALVAAFLAAYMAKDVQAAAKFSAIAKRSFKASSTLSLLEGLYLREKGTDGDALAVWVPAWRKDRKGFEAAAHEILAASAKSILAAIREAASGRTGANFFLPLGEVHPQTKRILELRVRPIPNQEARELVLAALVQLAGGQPYGEETASSFAKAAELAPGDRTLAWLHAQALLGRDRFDEAEQALEACRRAGASERLVRLYEADLMVRRGRFKDASDAMEELGDPQGPHDLAWHCARAQVVKDLTPGEDGIARALKILRAFRGQDRFLVYTFIRISFHHSDRRQIRGAILKQFQEEGLLDSGTLAFYCFEQSRRLQREQINGLFDVVVTASSRLMTLSKAAWPRLGLCQLTLASLPRQRWVLGWVRDRLEEALHVEPERPRLHLLRGVHSVLSGRPTEELNRHWERARELGADPREFAEWAKSLERRYKDLDLSRYR